MVISKFLMKGLMVVCSVAGGVSVLASEARCCAMASQENVQKTPYGYAYSGPCREPVLNRQKGDVPLILKELPNGPISKVKDIVPYLQILPSREERMSHEGAIPAGIYKASQYHGEHGEGWFILKYIPNGIGGDIEYLNTAGYNSTSKRVSIPRYPSGNSSEFLRGVINE